MIVKRWALDFQGFSKVEKVKKTSLYCKMKGIQTTFILQERLKMDYTTLIPESKEGQERPPKQMQSLYEVCEQVVDGRCARGKRYEIADLLVLLVLAKLAGMQSLLAGSRLGCRSGSAAARGVAPVVETHAVCQYVQLCPGASGQSTGQCRSGSLVRPQGSRRPVRRGTQSVSGAGK